MAYENVISALINTESGGNRYAQNPRSSAGGSAQFINSTWLSMVKKYRPDVAEGKSDAQILQLKYDPNLSREMATRYAEENSDFLKQRGFDATPGNIKLSHFAGPQGATDVLANPNETVRATLGDAAVKANPFMRNYTNAQLASWADRGMRKAGGSGGGDDMANVVRARFGQPDQKTEYIGEVGPMPESAKSDRSVVDKILSALGADVKSEVDSLDTFDANRLSRAETLINNAQKIGGRGDIAAAIGGPILAALGGYQRDQELERQKAANSAFDEKIKSAAGDVPPVISAMLDDPRYRQQGIEALLKLSGPKAAPQVQMVKSTDQYGRQIETPMQWNGREWVPLSGGRSEPQGAPQTGSYTQQPVTPAPTVQPSLSDQSQPSGVFGQQSVSRGGKTGMDGTPAAQAGPALQQAPAPAPLPPGIETGPAAPKEMIGPGLAQDIGPNGSPLWRRTQAGLQPLLIPQEQLKERGKLAAGEEQYPKVAEQFAGGVERLRQFPKEFGRDALENALGPWSGEVPPDSKPGLWGTGLSLDAIGQLMSRTWDEVYAGVTGVSAPTEVRDRINATVKNLAAVMKPLVRKPGEGVWTDKDQENLEAQIGKIDRSRTLEEYMRRVRDIEENVSKVFRIPIKEGERGTMSLAEGTGQNFSDFAKTQPRPQGMTDEDILRKALELVRGGADQNKIRAQLDSWGIRY